MAYAAKDISILKGLQPVRERPGMYIGSTGPSGLHHLVYEVVDNAVDEALAGYATTIDITLLPDGGCRVIDDGRGIPVDPHPEYPDKSAAEIVLTMLHAGGKFGGEGYKISGGLHGVGVSVVNALSRRLDLDIQRDGGRYVQSFVDGGEPVAPLERVGDSDAHGTSVTFWPDGTIMEELEFRAQTLLERLREMAFLNKGLQITFRDERVDPVFEQVRRDAALIGELGLKLLWTLDTHVHADHVTGAWLLKQRLGSGIALSAAAGASGADRLLADGERVDFGRRSLEVRATPGHTNGCVTYVLDDESMAFTGDCVMIRGSGRTDFQQGNARELYRSVRSRIFSLPG